MGILRHFQDYPPRSTHLPAVGSRSHPGLPAVDPSPICPTNPVVRFVENPRWLLSLILRHLWETADRELDTLILRHFLDPTLFPLASLRSAPVGSGWLRVFLCLPAESIFSFSLRLLRFIFNFRSQIRFEWWVMPIRHCPNSILNISMVFHIIEFKRR